MSETLADLPLRVRLAREQQLRLQQRQQRGSQGQSSDEEEDASRNRPRSPSSDEESADGGRPRAPTARSKNAPAERSSKVEVSRFRSLDLPKLGKSRDPRFFATSAATVKGTEAAGDLARFRRKYAFLEERANEEAGKLRGVLERQAPGAKRKKREPKLTPEQIAEAQSELTRLEQFRAETRRAEKLRELIKERAVGPSGKRRYLSSGELKDLRVEQRFTELSKKPKKLDRLLQKRRKVVRGGPAAADREESAGGGRRGGASMPPLGL